jgi:hypothetical protein
MAESAFSFSAFQLFSFSFMGNLEPLNLEPLNFERARAAALRPGGNEPQMAQMNADGSAPGPAPVKVPVCSGLPQTGTNWNLEVPFRTTRLRGLLPIRRAQVCLGFLYSRGHV